MHGATGDVVTHQAPQLGTSLAHGNLAHGNLAHGTPAMRRARLHVLTVSSKHSQQAHAELLQPATQPLEDARARGEPVHRLHVPMGFPAMAATPCPRDQPHACAYALLLIPALWLRSPAPHTSLPISGPPCPFTSAASLTTHNQVAGDTRAQTQASQRPSGTTHAVKESALPTKLPWSLPVRRAPHTHASVTSTAYSMGGNCIEECTRRFGG